MQEVQTLARQGIEPTLAQRRRLARLFCAKMAHGKNLPSLGRMLSRGIAKAHAYLRSHFLPHSEQAAALHRPKSRLKPDHATTREFMATGFDARLRKGLADV